MVSGVSLWKCTSTAARLLAMISSRVRSACDVTVTSLSWPAVRLPDICDNNNAEAAAGAGRPGPRLQPCGRLAPVSFIRFVGRWRARLLVESTAATVVRPIESRSVADEFFLAFGRCILTGGLEPGRELSLRELAGVLQVSIIPVREALRSLENQGLVQMRHGRSALVAPLDLDELQSIYRLRRRLEPEIAQRSCRLLPDAELDRLYLEAAEFGDPHRTMNEIYDSHHTFHLALLAPAATSWDLRILSTLWRARRRLVPIGLGHAGSGPHRARRRKAPPQGPGGAIRQRDPEIPASAPPQHLTRNEQ